jgi:hypothetical protein
MSVSQTSEVLALPVISYTPTTHVVGVGDGEHRRFISPVWVMAA